jgi:hypothetical protein
MKNPTLRTYRESDSILPCEQHPTCHILKTPNVTRVVNAELSTNTEETAGYKRGEQDEGERILGTEINPQ